MAQCIGLHKISNDPTLLPTDDAYHYELVEIEVGKRTWWQLVIQDHFSIQFTDTYS